MHLVCQYCKAFKFKNEASALYYSSSKVKLMPIVPSPEPRLHSLVSLNESNSKYYFTHIQQYNNCFQISSFDVTKVIQENCMPIFKVSIFILIYL